MELLDVPPSDHIPLFALRQAECRAHSEAVEVVDEALRSTSIVWLHYHPLEVALDFVADEDVPRPGMAARVLRRYLQDHEEAMWETHVALLKRCIRYLDAAARSYRDLREVEEREYRFQMRPRDTQWRRAR